MLNRLMSILTNPAGQVTWPEFSVRDLQVCLVLFFLVLLFALEARFALRRHPVRDVRVSYLANMSTFLFNDTLMSLMSVSWLIYLAEHVENSGLLSPLHDPFARFIAALVLFDFVLYVWHWANHRFGFLWMFHKIHHSDRCMNASTAFRLHFVEVFLTALVKALFVVATGVDTAVLVGVEFTITMFVIFHHANLRIPGERWLSWATVVPFLHRMHHSAIRSEHDSNYGALFSIWDRMFGTLRLGAPKALGLTGVSGQGFFDLLRFGFVPQRPVHAGVKDPRSIAEAAYFKAEKRGFAPGFEFADWVEAERELRDKPR
jgi:sterol desaturase/sphingolipid hydroxylase (fatty acid hydroxylase superfamily)